MAISQFTAREGCISTSNWPRVLLGLMAFAAFVICQTAQAAAETRVLKFYNLHTHERAEIVYKRNGQYVSSGLKQINHMLRDWRENEETRINPRLLDLLWQVYRVSGSRDYINVICGYRSPKTNKMLRRRSSGVAKESQHTHGNAIDFFLPDVPLSRLRAVALKMQDGGVGYYPTSGSPFVHLDIGNVRHWPRMSRQQLLALFPDGKTLHIPKDGKPLSGYNVALAAYKSRVSSGRILAEDGSTGSPRRGLLATLLGGGADDEQDSTDMDAVPSSRPAQQPRPTVVARAQQPAAAQPEAAEAPQTPSMILAALPAREVPVPRLAPRPDVDVGAQTPAAPVPTLTAATEAVSPADEAARQSAETKLAALDIPLPTWRPDYTPPAEEKIAVANASDAKDAGDAIEEILRANSRPAEGYALAPGLKPALENADREAPDSRIVTVASAEDKFADALALADDGREGRLPHAVSGSPRLAMLSETAGGRAAADFVPGVKTTPKDARPTIRDEKPEPEPIIVPVRAETARWALSSDAILGNSRDTTRPAFDAALIAAPETVYTAGFHDKVEVADAQRFTGKAVTFLAVARFATN